MWEEPVAAEEDLFSVGYSPPLNILNADQERVLGEVRGWLEADTFTASLLYGVTGSGKTEVYLVAVETALARGKTALLLVPEIALTLWLGRLCRARFGTGVAVLHSTLADVERAREWWRVRRGEARVVVGTRSAVFAPLENLGLVVVDEEQEASYKQEETPRYHGRDVAVMRAKLEGAVALLGSATPSLESFHNARTGKYRLLELGGRVENRPLAPVEIVHDAPRRAAFLPVDRGHRGAARTADAVADPHQPARVFLVRAVPLVRGGRLLRELQHFAHLSQEARAAGMSLLRIFATRAGSLSEMLLRAYLLFRGRRRTARGCRWCGWPPPATGNCPALPASSRR